MLCGNFRGIRSQHLLDSIWKWAARPVVILSIVSLSSFVPPCFGSLVLLCWHKLPIVPTPARPCILVLARHLSFMANAMSRPSHRRLFDSFVSFIPLSVHEYQYSSPNIRSFYALALCSMRNTYPRNLPFILFYFYPSTVKFHNSYF